MARRCVWFKQPEEALRDPTHFIAHVLTYGLHEDVRTLRRHVTDAELAEAVAEAPAGVFDGRSWAYWQWILFGRRTPPPLPERQFDTSDTDDVRDTAERR